MDDQSNPALFNENLAALRPYLSDALVAFLTTDTPPNARLVTDNNGVLNLDIGSRLLYEPDADSYCREQVDNFLENPVRRVSLIASNFLFQPDQLGPVGEPFSFTPRPMDAERLAAMLPDPEVRIAGDIARDLLPFTDGKSLEWFPDEDSGHLVIFGLGIGKHVAGLVNGLDIRHLILVEQYPDFLKLCLHAVDWRPIVDAVVASGGTLSFIVGNDPDVLATDIINLLCGAYYSRIDGAYFQTHFKTDVFERTIAIIQERSPDIERSQGFFEDELLMIRNTAANLVAGSPRLYHDTSSPLSRKTEEKTIMIVGSGPSVTASMRDIVGLRDHGLPVISAGTGIGPLQAAGITPDAHCELENIPEMVEVISAYDPEDLKSVTLLGSSTLDPRIPPFFAETVYVLRSELSSSLLFAKGFPTTAMVGPTVANMACRTAIGLGYTRLLLFGIDLGSKDPDRHHADDTLYYTQEGEWWESGNDMDAFVIPVAGNKGGTVYTNQPFLGARSAFEALFREAPGVSVLNFSDGIRIAGAAPMEAGELHIAEPQGVVRFRSQLKALPSVNAGDVHLKTRTKEFCGAFRRWAGKADRLLASLEARHTDLDALLDAIDALISPGRDIRKIATHEDLAALCAKGSLLSGLQFGHTVYRRLPEKDRAACLQAFIASLRRHIAAMSDRMATELEPITGKG